MIHIENKKDCCGCEACVQKCPKHCIAFKQDKEGFFYPQVDSEKCIDCHLCEKVCPIINQGQVRKPKFAYAAFNSDSLIRMKSSSGGAFTWIATKVIEQGGVVFGACYDEYWNVIHSYTESTEGLERFRGSKYVQSRIGTTYKRAKEFLDSGRYVLFTGTPCQIRGLKLFLRKDYNNLYTADFVCHGVPSPKIWQQYLCEELERIEKTKTERSSADGKNTVLSLSLIAASALADIAFRDKNDYGWEKYCFVIRKKSGNKARQNSVLLSDIHYNNPYFSLFLSHVLERYSCYDCPAKSGKSGSDLTMGDYWGIDYDQIIKKDDKGVSLLMAHSDKGKWLMDGLVDSKRSFQHAVAHNPMIVTSLKSSKLRYKTYDAIEKKGVHSVSLYVRRRKKIIQIVNKILCKMHINYQWSE